MIALQKSYRRYGYVGARAYLYQGSEVEIVPRRRNAAERTRASFWGH